MSLCGTSTWTTCLSPVRRTRTGDQVGDVSLEKVTAFLEDRFRHVAIEPVPELSFHLLIVWGKRRRSGD